MPVDSPSHSPSDSDLAEVRLLGVPLRLRELAAQHGEELMRELALIQIGAQHHVADSVPKRLLDIAAEVQGTYGAFNAQPNEEMDAALDRGEHSADVVYRVPPHVVPFIHRLRTVLAEVDEYCRRGDHLLTLAPPQEVVEYREWVFQEFERQVAGAAPRPWRAGA